MSNVANRQWPHSQSPAGWPTTTNAAVPTTQPYPVVRMPTVSPAAAEILRDAVWHIDAAEHLASGANPKTVRNLGWGGSVLNARCGSTTVADSNDPLFLPYYGTPYVYLPGIAGNYMSTPDAASLRITGDIDIRVCVNYQSVAASQVFISKWKTTSGIIATWDLAVASTNFLTFTFKDAGGTIKSATSTTAIDPNAGIQWLRVTRHTATGDVYFYRSADGVSWIQIGTGVYTPGGAMLSGGTSDVTVGAREMGAIQITASIYRAQIYDGINGTLVFDADTSVLTSGSQTTFVEKSANAATVTINRATSGRKSVAVVAPAWLFGTDDMMYVGTPTSQLLCDPTKAPFSALIVSRQASYGGSQGMLGKVAGSGANYPGWLIRNSGGTPAVINFGITDVTGTSIAVASAARSNLALTVAALVRDPVARQLSGYTNSARVSASDAAGLGLWNGVQLTIGNIAVPSAYCDMEFMAAAYFRRQLTDAEVATLTSYYTGKYK